MLGFIVATKTQSANATIAEASDRLINDGVVVVGACQINDDPNDGTPYHMDLHMIPDGQVIRISQSLGPLSSGCRLDPAALEQAVGLANAQLATQPQLFIANKFGKQEAEGRGFRPVIAEALGQGVPVLLAVRDETLPSFHAFTDGIGQELPNDIEAVLRWARATMDECAQA